jgi:hypothetical protein
VRLRIVFQTSRPATVLLYPSRIAAEGLPLTKDLARLVGKNS